MDVLHKRNCIKGFSLHKAFNTCAQVIIGSKSDHFIEHVEAHASRPANDFVHFS